MIEASNLSHAKVYAEALLVLLRVARRTEIQVGPGRLYFYSTM